MLTQRTAEEWRTLRRRIRAEGSELELDACLEFVAEEGEEAWNTAAPPLRDEPLSQRLQAYRELAANSKQAQSLFATLGDALGPEDDFRETMRAGAAFAGVAGPRLDCSTLRRIVENRGAQPLLAVLQSLSQALLLRPDQTLEQAALALTQGGVQEREDRVIIAGVSLRRRSPRDAPEGPRQGGKDSGLAVLNYLQGPACPLNLLPASFPLSTAPGACRSGP